MEKISPQPQSSPQIVPLARDSDGNIIQLPDDAVGWRIRRQTGGRPRLHLDSKKQPMTFPLDYTVADAEDILAPGNYLLDAIDKNGEPLGVTIGLAIGMPRNAESVEPDDASGPVVVPTSLPAATSDMRLVLEANVRATQMAFLHNQKTLEIGLRMAETLRDGVQVLASAQADWIKSVSSARGFFRNAPPPLPPVEVKQLTVKSEDDEDDEQDEDDDEDEGYDEAPPPPSWMEQYGPLLGTLAQQLMPAIGAWMARQQAGGKAGHRSPTEVAEFFNGGRSKKAKAQGERKAPGANAARRAATPTPSPASPPPAAWPGTAAAPSPATAAPASWSAAEPSGPWPDEESSAPWPAEEPAAAWPTAASSTTMPIMDVGLLTVLRSLPPEMLAKLMLVREHLLPDEQEEALRILRALDTGSIAHLARSFEAQTAEQSVATLRGLIADWRAIEDANARPPVGAPGAAPPAAGSSRVSQQTSTTPPQRPDESA